jgi:hypothetical protein
VFCCAWASDDGDGLSDVDPGTGVGEGLFGVDAAVAFVGSVTGARGVHEGFSFRTPSLVDDDCEDGGEDENDPDCRVSIQSCLRDGAAHILTRR